MTTPVVPVLSCQFPTDLIGVPLEEVYLTWRVDAPQEAQQIRWRNPGADWVEQAPVDDAAAIEVLAPGGALRSREVREFAVRIRSGQRWSEWSEPCRVEAGVQGRELLAQVVCIDSPAEGPAPHLRTEFDAPAGIQRAVLRVSGLGVVEPWLNGHRTDDEHLAPGWTSYGQRILLATHDVTRLIRPGRNALAVVVADGWYRGRIGWAGHTGVFGQEIGALVQLELQLSDGNTQLVTTGPDWRGGFGPVRTHSIYDGTSIDHTLDIPGFSEPGFDDSAWQQVQSVPVDLERFEPRRSAPIRTVEERPMSIAQRPGRLVLDSGQNFSGWVRLEVDGSAGTVVTVRHAELLEPDGTLHTKALRTAKATDTYVLAGGRQVLEPRFTFHGFRYADVVTEARVLSATAVAISSDLPSRSSFECSVPELNQFHSNVIWSQRSNFLSVPTDCPQRDERLGWTGDAQAFAPTANTLLHSESFWASWLRDLELDQSDERGVPSVVPNIIGGSGPLVFANEVVDDMGRAGWADAATIVPWAVYESYGGTLVLRRQLSSMRRWVDHLRRRAGNDVLLPHEPFQYGDWLDPDAPGDRPWEAKVSVDFVANAFYVWSVKLLARAETLVGDPTRVPELEAVADAVAHQLWSEFGEHAAATQTGAALALEFGLCPTSERPAVAEGLARRVREVEGRIETGFLGTPLVLFALSRAGYLDEAYQMLLRRDAPSWLYQVGHGATTVWERWDAIAPDGTIHRGEMDGVSGEGSMISFNHYAYGAVIDWVYRNVAGLEPVAEAPGYVCTRVGPRPGRELTWARASIQTAMGELSIEWQLVEDRLEVALRVPHGVTAELDLPLGPDSTVEGASARELGAGDHQIVVHRPMVAAR